MEKNNQDLLQPWDLLVHIRWDEKETSLHFALTAANPDLNLFGTPFGVTLLATRPKDYVEALFSTLKEIGSVKTSYWPKKARTLRQIIDGFGTTLFEQAFPIQLQKKLWSLREKYDSLLIHTQEPWIPWELCKLKNPDPGVVNEEPYLCEKYAMARWLLGAAPQLELEIRRIGVIAPTSATKRQVQEEEDLIRACFPFCSVTSIPPTLSEVRTHLGSGRFDLIHFICHGQRNRTEASDQGYFEDQPSGLVLEDEIVFPDIVPKRITRKGSKPPLVFMNACHSGKLAFGLSGIDGWASRFLAAGAGAFVGAHYVVDMDAALLFARIFYQSLRGGLPIAEAVRQARLAVMAEHPVTSLAYTLFADPRTRLNTTGRRFPGTLAKYIDIRGIEGPVPAFPEQERHPISTDGIQIPNGWDRHEESLLAHGLLSSVCTGPDPLLEGFGLCPVPLDLTLATGFGAEIHIPALEAGCAGIYLRFNGDASPFSLALVLGGLRGGKPPRTAMLVLEDQEIRVVDTAFLIDFPVTSSGLSLALAPHGETIHALVQGECVFGFDTNPREFQTFGLVVFLGTYCRFLNLYSVDSDPGSSRDLY